MTSLINHDPFDRYSQFKYFKIIIRRNGGFGLFVICWSYKMIEALPTIVIKEEEL